jgi:hypothetical protein
VFDSPLRALRKRGANEMSSATPDWATRSSLSTGGPVSDSGPDRSEAEMPHTTNSRHHGTYDAEDAAFWIFAGVIVVIAFRDVFPFVSSRVDPAGCRVRDRDGSLVGFPQCDDGFGDPPSASVERSPRPDSGSRTVVAPWPSRRVSSRSPFSETDVPLTPASHSIR